MNAYNKLKEWVLLLLVDLGRLTPEEANNILMEKKNLEQKLCRILLVDQGFHSR